MRVTLVALVFAAFSIRAQTPSFEVASIKPTKPGVEGTNIQGDPSGKLNATNVTLKDLIRFCYQIRDFQISGGPKWLDEDRFDIAAKPEAKAQPEQLLSMMQQLLTERFQLVFHKETREAQVYELVAAKNGPKLHTPEKSDKRGIQGRKGQINAWGTSMAIFAKYLSQRLERNVVDKTGLSEDFDFSLNFAPDSEADKSDAGPSIFTALQEQLGLRLQTAKGPVEVFVIDRATKPTDN